jgi:ketosteroid isomerase-like protein
MSSERVRAARTGYVAVNRADWPAMMAVLDPAVQWRMSTRFARAERLFHGHDGVRDLFAFFEESFEGFHAEPHEFIDADPWVVVPVTLSGRVRGSGEPATFELVQAYRFRDGLIVQHEAYATAEDALAAVRSGASSTNSDGGAGRAK